MKYICVADLHIQAKAPEHRIDNYLHTAINKFRQILHVAHMHKANIICAGDFFNNVNVGMGVINITISYIRKFKGDLYLVAGQHDMFYHNHDLKRTPLQTLLFQKNVHLLRPDKPIKIGKDYLYGCSFGENISKEFIHENSILVIHKTITESDPPYFLPEAISANTALSLFKDYSYIISGDFHEAFEKHTSTNMLVNCGPMLRSEIDKKNFKPKMWLLNTQNTTVEPIFFNIRPSNEVFDMSDPIEENTLLREELEDLIDTIKKNSKIPKYLNTVQYLCKKANINKRVINHIKTIFDEVENGTEL